jgi:hypothetical protein
MRRHIRTLGVVLGYLLSGALAGCATGYQAHGITGGYSERRISDSAYVVTFNGNGFASHDRVYNFWLYRCAELTLSHGYTLFSARPDQANAQRSSEDARAQPALYQGTEGAAPTNTAFVPMFIPAPVPTEWVVSSTVLMYKAPLAPEVIWALDAERIQDALKSYVQHNGDGPAPDRDELFDTALLAHEIVDLGGQRASSAATPESGDGGLAPFKNPRSVAEISGIVKHAGLIAYLSAFHEYRDLHGAAAPGGEIRMDFTVRATGQAANLHVTAASIADSELIARVQAVLSRTYFGARDVADTDVRNFVIAFRPL